MNKVEPIRDKQKIEDMKTQLLKSSLRNYMIFVVGINTGLRISDILKLKVKDVKDKSHIKLKEGKTNKSKKFYINSELKKELDKYIKNMAGHEYLFQSRNGTNKPLSRSQTYRI